jgi:DNA-binding CsgD family transcriptional regulator
MIFAFPFHSYARPVPFVSKFLRTDGGMVIERYLREDDSDDIPSYTALSNMPPQKLYPEIAAMGVNHDKDLPYSSMRNFLLQEGGIRCRLGAKLNLSGPWLDMVAFHPRVPSHDISPQVYEDTNLVLPVIAKSLNTYRAFETLNHNYGMRLRALDYLAIGAVLVDDTGMVVYGNSYANEVLSERDSMYKLANGRIGFDEPKISARFQSILNKACYPARNIRSNEISTLSVPRKSGVAPYFIKAHALTDSDNETDIHFPFALLFFIDPAKGGSLSSDGIDAMSLLTPAEADICSLLLAGTATGAIAKERDVSINTVRQQIKSVLSKLECRNRNELFNVAIASHLPIRKTD